MKEGRDGAHLIASIKPFQTLGPEYEMHFWPIDLSYFGRANSLMLDKLSPLGVWRQQEVSHLSCLVIDQGALARD